MVEQCDTVLFASDPMHTARARRFAVELRPDLAGRFVRGAQYRRFERWWLKVPTAAYEVGIASRDRRRASGRARAVHGAPTGNHRASGQWR